MSVRRWLNHIRCARKTLVFYLLYTLAVIYLSGRWEEECETTSQIQRKVRWTADELSVFYNYRSDTKDAADETSAAAEERSIKSALNNLEAADVHVVINSKQKHVNETFRVKPTTKKTQTNYRWMDKQGFSSKNQGVVNLGQQWNNLTGIGPGKLRKFLTQSNINLSAVVDVSSHILDTRGSEDVQSLRDNAIHSGIFLHMENSIAQEIQSATKGNVFNPLSEYKNPCWKVERPKTISNMYNSNQFYVHNIDVVSRGNMRLNMQRHQRQFSKGRITDRTRCIPYFYVAGITKGGTTDFCQHINKLPGVIGGASKETLYWNRIRIGKLINATFSEYIDTFDSVGISMVDSHVRDHITFDCSPCYLWDFHEWRLLPGNHNLTQPKYILAHTLRALYPGTRVIALLRNPIDRVFSHWRMWHHHDPPSLFHEMVVDAMKKLVKCFARENMRECVYGTSACGKPVFEMGRVCRLLCASLYYVYVRDWMAVFPDDQILVLKSEEYFADRSSVLSQTADFLKLEDVRLSELEGILAKKPINSVAETKRSKEGILPMTVALLKQFYAPFNKELSGLLKDKKWLWKDTH